ERLLKLARHLKPGYRLLNPCRLHAAFVEARGFPEVALELRVGWQIGQAGDSSEVSGGFALLAADNEGSLPHGYRAVLLERRNPADHAFMDEEGRAPLDGLFDVRDRLMNDIARVLEYRPGKLGRFGDVGVNPRVAFTHLTPLPLRRRARRCHRA